MSDGEQVSPEVSAKASSLILDTIATILSDDETTRGYVPVKGLLIYVYMKDNGHEIIHSFGSDGIWATEAIGLCEVAKFDLLNGGLEEEEEEA
jgi:hypothetical protein